MDVVGISSDMADSATTTTVDNGTMDKEDFLQLLVTQLQYQDPLNPMENTEMAAQLAQYSQLETLNNIQETMESQLLLDQSLNNSFMTSMIGRDVLAYGNGVEYSGEDVNLEYYLAGSGDVTVSVYDEDGKLVKTIDAGNQRYGDRSVSWDGTNTYGEKVDDGSYYFKVEATDSDGDAITAYTYTSGLIEGLTYEDGSPYLIVNGQMINLGNVISLSLHDDTDG